MAANQCFLKKKNVLGFFFAPGRKDASSMSWPPPRSRVARRRPRGRRRRRTWTSSRRKWTWSVTSLYSLEHFLYSSTNRCCGNMLPLCRSVYMHTLSVYDWGYVLSRCISILFYCILMLCSCDQQFQMQICLLTILIGKRWNLTEHESFTLNLGRKSVFIRALNIKWPTRHAQVSP